MTAQEAKALSKSKFPLRSRDDLAFQSVIDQIKVAASDGLTILVIDRAVGDDIIEKLRALGYEVENRNDPSDPHWNARLQTLIGWG
jgi:hypothetical protein